MIKITKILFWRKADIFSFTVYKLTKKFPKEELLGIPSQL
jgi:hypothetical protein